MMISHKQQVWENLGEYDHRFSVNVIYAQFKYK